MFLIQSKVISTMTMRPMFLFQQSLLSNDDNDETKRNKQCYYGWLYLSTDSSKLMPIRDWAALLKPSPRWVNAPAPLSLHHSSPQRSLLRSVLESLCSCSSCLFLSRVFNQIASTTNLFCLSHILHNSELSLNRNLS